MLRGHVDGVVGEVGGFVKFLFLEAWVLADERRPRVGRGPKSQERSRNGRRSHFEEVGEAGLREVNVGVGGVF